MYIDKQMTTIFTIFVGMPYTAVGMRFGEIWLYDPDLERVQVWAVPTLLCVANEAYDRLVANPEGEVHGVIIPVPVSVMEKAGTYRFVLHFYDDYADSYKNHQVKAALEVNSIPATLQFTVETDPKGDSQEGSPGHKKGEKDTTRFYVVIKATLDYRGKPGFNTIGFSLKRTKTGEVRMKTGYLVTDPNDPDGPKDLRGGLKRWTFRTHELATEKGVTDWIITEMKGRWEIKVAPPHESNTVKFKINKRRQIVIVANSWVGTKPSALELCNMFVARVYNHVKISLPGDLQAQYDSTESDTGKGCLIFYASRDRWPQWNPAHVGIQDGDFIIDTNCTLDHGSVVEKHGQNLPIYPDRKKKSPKELKDLDGE